MGIAFDLHIHSSYSLDSVLFPQLIIRLAKLKGLGVIAITDHDTIQGGLKTRLVSNKGPLVIVGSEVKTDFGDLIGLFLYEDLRSKRFGEVLDEIKDQGGVTVLPHPYRRKAFPPDNLLKKVDVIEGLNGRSSTELNQKGLMLAESLGKPVIAGSDAHFPFELGLAKAIGDIQSADEEFFRTNLLKEHMNLSSTHLIASIRKASILCSYAIKKIRSIQ